MNLEIIPPQKQTKIDSSLVSKSPRKLAQEGVDYSDEWSFRKVTKNLQCKKIMEDMTVLPIYSQATWNHMRHVYRAVMEESIDRDGVSITAADAASPTSGFLVPIEVRRIEGKGRGVFVLRDVAKGEPLWSKKNAASFSQGTDFRKFIFSLQDDKVLTCQILNFWCK
jgi:hypothetical protein